MDFTTPALLFPALSLILLAYTNRFFGLSNIIRHLHGEYQRKPDDVTLRQIDNLRHRVTLIRNMQIFGVASMVSCVLSMLSLFGPSTLGVWLFALSLLLMLISLLISVVELYISGAALEILLAGMEKDLGKVSERQTSQFPFSLPYRRSNPKAVPPANTSKSDRS